MRLLPACLAMLLGGSAAQALPARCAPVAQCDGLTCGAAGELMFEIILRQSSDGNLIMAPAFEPDLHQPLTRLDSAAAAQSWGGPTIDGAPGMLMVSLRPDGGAVLSYHGRGDAAPALMASFFCTEYQ